MIRLLVAFLASAGCAFAAYGAPPPPWLGAALERMPEEMPSGLAYTLDLDRNGQLSSERFDPTRPAGARWSLLTRGGRMPSSGEFTEYSRLRAGSLEPGFRSSFRRQQVDLASARVLHETATHATVQVGFSATATDADKMLGRLELTLEVRIQPAAVLSYRLRLRAPYSPVIGVKMHELDAGAEFDNDARPRRSWSRFRGRILFRSVEENIESRYRDFLATAPPD